VVKLKANMYAVVGTLQLHSMFLPQVLVTVGHDQGVQHNTDGSIKHLCVKLLDSSVYINMEFMLEECHIWL
jgi:hypothetical protein